ncbi:MAG: alpha-amylase [Lachnospiraceae bacterium]|nr:alpha-amylase [Lachnospiraceae bacterium]
MAWYDEAVFYHIYPLGMTGAPKTNDYGKPVHRLNTLIPWIGHLKDLGFTGLYIGPLFESVGHGYETTDYKKLDSRLGTNEDLTAFVKECHKNGIRVILDGVFNHTGRDFFAFRDLKEHRENSPYRDWYSGIWFGGNNEYNDGFSYENWGGYNLLVKLNQKNPAVRDYICDVVRFWVKEFDIDGLRLDAADVLDFDFMKALRHTADEVKQDFWLMGEVIHGDYSRWANDRTLHSVTNYALHKAFYSGHNDHNYFEIAHTVKRTLDMLPGEIRLYNFVDNHDVERIYTKLNNKANYMPVHILLYTLPGIPSVYYGSEFGIEGRKERGSDDSLRPYLEIGKYLKESGENPHAILIGRLGKIRASFRDLSYSGYEQLLLTNGQYAFSRGRLIIAVNNEDHEAWVNVPARAETYTGLIGGSTLKAEGGRLNIRLGANSGEIFAEGGIAADEALTDAGAGAERDAADDAETPGKTGNEVPKEEASEGAADTAVGVRDAGVSDGKAAEETHNEAVTERPVEDNIVIPDIPYEEMTVEQLQAVILRKLASNGPVTDRMRKDVEENIWKNSLVNWAKSFR